MKKPDRSGYPPSSSKFLFTVYADQLVKPEVSVLYKGRQEGGLNMINVKYRAMAELIKSFLDTAINSTFKRNIYHQALYSWHVEGVRTIPDPGHPPYYSTEFFNAIKEVKAEGLLRLSGMTLGMWYKVLLENHVTQETDGNGFSFNIRSKTETQNPNINWDHVWALSILPGLDSSAYCTTFYPHKSVCTEYSATR